MLAGQERSRGTAGNPGSGWVGGILPPQAKERKASRTGERVWREVYNAKKQCLAHSNNIDSVIIYQVVIGIIVAELANANPPYHPQTVKL